MIELELDCRDTVGDPVRVELENENVFDGLLFDEEVKLEDEEDLEGVETEFRDEDNTDI